MMETGGNISYDVWHSIELVLAFLTSFLLSAGFWTWLGKKTDKKDNSKKLLMGLAYVRIMELASLYLERGFVYRDEYETLHSLLLDPYIAMSGNSLSKRMIEEVNKLAIKNTPFVERIITPNVPK